MLLFLTSSDSVFWLENYLDGLLRLDVDYEHSVQGWLSHINKLVLDVDR